MTASEERVVLVPFSLAVEDKEHLSTIAAFSVPHIFFLSLSTLVLLESGCENIRSMLMGPIYERYIQGESKNYIYGNYPVKDPGLRVFLVF